MVGEDRKKDGVGYGGERASEGDTGEIKIKLILEFLYRCKCRATEYFVLHMHCQIMSRSRDDFLILNLFIDVKMWEHSNN